MTIAVRIPHGNDPVEIRQAFQRLKRKSENIDISDDTNLAVTAPIVLTGDTLSLNQAGIDHGSIGGLSDDDHTIYSLIDGTRAFSGVVVGVDPVNSNQLATKEYVDSAISFIQEFFLTDTASGIGSYFNMVDQHTGQPESSDSTGSISQDNGQALTEWITVASVPGITDLEHGIYSVHINVEKTGAGARDVRIYFEVWTRTHPGGLEVLRTTSEVSDLITSKTSIDLHAILAADIAINETDRIVVKFFANGVSGGNDATIVLYSEGTTASHFGMPISSEVLSTIFLRQDGTKALAGNMLVDGGITIDGRDLSVDGTKLDGIEALADVTDATNVAAAGAAMSGGAFHDGFSDFVGNKHIDHTAVTLTAGNGLVGGGDISASRTFDLDINSLATTTKIDPGDFIPHWDITATATNKKITFANFESYINHDNLTGFVANEHIDWTNASSALLTSGTGQFSNIGIGTAATILQLEVYGAPIFPASGSTNVINVVFEPSTVSDCSTSTFAMSFVVRPGVDNAVTNSGKCASILGSALGETSFVGNLTRLIGIQNQYGIITGTGTVTYLYGLYLQPYHQTGTIGAAYDIIIGAPITGGTVTNQWCIYSLNPADSYLIGALGLGQHLPDARLEVETGATEGKQAVTIDQNDEDQVFIDFQGASEASAAKSVSTWTTGNSIQGFMWVEINGVKKRMPYYDEPTS